MRKMLALLCSLSLTTSLTAFAAPPDAGSILREQQQGPRFPDRLPKPDESAVERPSLTDSDVKVVVKAFRCTGIASMATESELQKILKDAVGKEQGLTDLQRLAGLITGYLRGKGFFLARAYLPKQDITSGIVEIAVIGGRLDGSADIRAQEPRSIRDRVLRAMVDSAVKTGEVLNESDLERVLMLLNDLPGITARGTLERGATPGSTKVVVDVSEGPLLAGGLSVDNYGNRYTGVWRGTGSAIVNDPLGIGDQLSLSYSQAEGLYQGRVGYSAQLHPRGLRGGISYTSLYYELGKEFKSLNYSGHANTIGANISYPVLRSRPFSLWGNLSYEYRMFNDNGALVSNRNVHAVTADLTSSGYDTFNGGGLTSSRLAVTTGSIDTATANASSSYFKLGYSVSRLQQLIGDVSLFVSANGQLANNNLDSSEKFILGGPSGVRSYPVGEANGDDGHSFTTELRYDVPVKVSYGALQMIGFLDAGNITLHQTEWTNSVTTATGKNNYWLTGSGLGVNMSKSSLYSLRATWAHTLGDNAGRSNNGANADGLSEANRFWLQASVWF